MNIPKKNLSAWAALVFIVLAHLLAPAVHASTAITSVVTVNYTINSITNLTNPGDLSGLEIVGNFDLAALENNPYQLITGTGSVTPIMSIPGSSPVVGSYLRTFQLDASAAVGSTVSANYLAWFSLAFNNVSSDEYDVSLSLNYDLSTNASGENAFTDATLSFFNESGSFSNLDAPGYAQAVAGAIDEALASDSQLFNFRLAAGASETVYADATISATLAPVTVPVPPSFWSFTVGLFSLVGLRKSTKVKNPTISA
ncbi:MAG: hypothetical protein CTY19_15995 [Methylomonas sp.]|nr:MAG: hypothetical protein CTY19_15995 [Methylomonas sp.]